MTLTRPPDMQTDRQEDDSLVTEFDTTFTIDEQQLPVYHIGLRLTKPAEEVPAILEHLLKIREGPFKDHVWQHCYVNHPADADVAHDHSHVYCCECTDLKELKKLKLLMQKTLNRKGIKGNSQYAISVFKGGFKEYAFYAKHADTPLIGGTDEQNDLYTASDVYVKHPIDIDDEDIADDDIHKTIKKPYKALGDFNLVKVMRKFCRLKRIGVHNFKDVFIRLLNETEWRPSKALSRPFRPWHIQEFENGSKTIGNGTYDYFNSSSGW